MTKKEIRERLRAQHIRHWDSMQEWIQGRMRRGDSDREIQDDPIFDLQAMRLNTILKSAKILDVELDRIEVNSVTVRIARETLHLNVRNNV